MNELVEAIKEKLAQFESKKQLIADIQAEYDKCAKNLMEHQAAYNKLWAETNELIASLKAALDSMKS